MARILKRTKQEILEKEVMDRLLGRPLCSLGHCEVNHEDINARLNTDDVASIGRGFCPKCGYPWEMAGIGQLLDRRRKKRKNG